MADTAAQYSKNESRIADMAAQCLPNCSPDQRPPKKPLLDLPLLDHVSREELVESVVKYSLEEIEVEYPEDFIVLDQSNKSELAQIAREVAKEQVYLNTTHSQH